MSHDQAPIPGSEELERAWQALESGDHVLALQELSAIGERNAERWVPECLARAQLADFPRAELALGRAAAALGSSDPSVLWARGELRLSEWRFDEARLAFEELLADPESDSDASLCERLALLSDLEGLFEQADQWLERAHAIDPETYPGVFHLPPHELDQLIQASIAALPERFASCLESVPVIVDPVPTRAHFPGVRTPEHAPDLLGLFSGANLAEQGLGGELPPVIYLFQRNLERGATSREELCQELEVTLYHELGHYLGFDEEGVESLGLG